MHLRSWSKKISCIVQNQKIHYHVHTTPSLVYMLGQMNPARHHISFRYTFILSSQLHLGLSSGFFLSGFLIKTLYTFFLSPACVMFPTHLILFNFDHPNRLWQGVYMELNFMCLSLGSCYFLPIRPKYLFSILFWTPSAHAPHLVWHTKFHTHKKIIHIPFKYQVFWAVFFSDQIYSSKGHVWTSKNQIMRQHET